MTHRPTPAKPASASASPAYRSPSPAQSSSSNSEAEDIEDANKSVFFNDPVAQAPAAWSHPRRAAAAQPTSSATSPIVRLPTEIVIHILRYLHSARDLYRSMLVCRTWCECSVELLWHKPSIVTPSTLVKMMRVLSDQDRAFTYALFVRRLNFLFLGSALTDGLFGRVSQCVKLERLTLVGCSALSDEAMTRAFECFPNLVAIDLTGVTHVSDRAIVALASASRRLQGINLSGCRRVTDEGVLALAYNCSLLRRVKLSNLEAISDDAVTAIAKACPLILEIDLNQCKRITDRAVRDLWTHSFHMREMRLAGCVELTDAAFPAPARSDIMAATTATNNGNNPFPMSKNIPNSSQELPALRLTRRFDHLRMLDLTSCMQITDDAIEGIIANAPKIRNLVLAKCHQLSDRSVEAICRLGKHLHYLHLGHCSTITDPSVKTLARACIRLRYIDLANCTNLTDMAVFELSSLPKLRRVGLVRVSNLTDEAIYTLGERHATLERIHLSYCNRITIMSIHFLLQKLPKLTHLSLTGIPAFRRPELQRFCRPPPSDFNSSQRAAFCVFSGKGVTELREYLVSLFESLTENLRGVDENTEYDEEGFDEVYPPNYLDDEAAEFEAEAEDGDGFVDGEVDEERDFTPSSNEVASAPAPQAPASTPRALTDTPRQTQLQTQLQTPGASSSRHHAGPPYVVESDAESETTPIAPRAPYPPASVPSPSRGRGFGDRPLVEPPSSPPPSSDAGSVRSAGTVNSNGAGFFRTYHLATPGARSAEGAGTPDLVYAEIGHGRLTGTQHGVVLGSTGTAQHFVGRPVLPPVQVMPNGIGHPMGSFAHHGPGTIHAQVLADSSNAMHHPAPPQWAPSPPSSSSSSTGTRVSTSSTLVMTRTSHDAPGPSSSSVAISGVQQGMNGAGVVDDREQTPDPRVRNVKRSFRSALNAAFFGRNSTDGGSGRPGGPGADLGTRGH